MQYGKDFWCVGVDGSRLLKPAFPKLLPFFYEDGDGGWYVLEDFTVEFLFKGKLYRLTVKAGFDYDGASIPRICRSIVGDKMAHDIIVAALFHDLFYCVHHTLFPKSVSDALLGQIQGVYFATWAKQKATVAAVQAFGFSCWGKTQEEMDKYAPFLVVSIAG